jgi:hypothetical protein
VAVAGGHTLGDLIAASGRPWWQVRYRDGRVRSEWDTLPGSERLPLAERVPPASARRVLGPASRWEDLDLKGLIGVRLLCPNGMAAELAAREDRKIFQLKVGGLAVVGWAESRTWCDAQVIGAVTDPSGACVCRAWEMRERRLVEFEDNVFEMRYGGIGALSLDNLGLTV